MFRQFSMLWYLIYNFLQPCNLGGSQFCNMPIYYQDYHYFVWELESILV